MALKFFLYLIAAAGVCVATSPAYATERLQESASYFGTVVNVTVCYETVQRDAALSTVKVVLQRFSDIHARMNRFDPSSDVSRINTALGQEVKVHDDVYALLERSKGYAELTRGVFDVTVGPLVALWRQSGDRGRIPTSEEVLEVKRLIGVDRIELLGHGRVKMPADMKIDLGGNVAGFAADEAASILRVVGFKDFMINAGGEIYVSGQACEGRPWRLAVDDPENRGRWADIVELKDRGVSTSGSYEKYVEINGQRWPHIINPLTGYPERGVVSATVIAPYAVDADVLSTALCILGPRTGFPMIEALGSGYAAMIMMEDEAGKLQKNMTRDYAQYKVK